MKHKLIWILIIVATLLLCFSPAIVGLMLSNNTRTRLEEVDKAYAKPKPTEPTPNPVHVHTWRAWEEPLRAFDSSERNGIYIQFSVCKECGMARQRFVGVEEQK